MELFVKFMAREPNPEAMLERLGLFVETAHFDHADFALKLRAALTH